MLTFQEYILIQLYCAYYIEKKIPQQHLNKIFPGYILSALDLAWYYWLRLFRIFAFTHIIPKWMKLFVSTGTHLSTAINVYGNRTGRLMCDAKYIIINNFIRT